MALFAFENVFLEDENTFEVYDHMCRSAVEGAVRGTNSTVFAYGQDRDVWALFCGMDSFFADFFQKTVPS